MEDDVMMEITASPQKITDYANTIKDKALEMDVSVAETIIAFLMVAVKNLGKVFDDEDNPS